MISGSDANGSIFKTSISNRKISIIPQANNICYSISLFEVDGRLITRKSGLAGTASVPVAGKGIYIMNVNYNGIIEKKLISVY